MLFIVLFLCLIGGANGLYRHTGTDTQIYVSRGSGFWGPPMRVLAPAEISLLRLSAG
jgi:predicted MPP superfamily phosphohydrolase